MASTLWIGTRKGPFSLRPDARRRTWRLSGPQLLGHIIHHVVQDPREPRRLCWPPRPGISDPPSIARSIAAGTGRKHRRRRPFARPRKARSRAPSSASSGSRPATVRAGCLVCGHFTGRPVSLRGSAALHWAPVAGFNDHPMHPKWAAGLRNARTASCCTRSSSIRAMRAHLYLAISIGGVFESTDGGKDWAPLNEGSRPISCPIPTSPFGHDPHCVMMHPQQPDRLYQQNHCGIYRLDRPARRWQRIGKPCPKAIGDIGFPIVAHPRDPGYGLGVAHGRHDRLAAHLGRWQARRLQDAQRAAGAGSAGTAGCRGRGPGSPSCVRRCAPIRSRESDFYFGTTGGEVWASTDGGNPGAASRSTCLRSIRSPSPCLSA